MIHGNPVLLAETYDRTEKGAMAPNILSDISYFYQTGYALFLEDTSRVKNYFTFDFGGMVNNRLRNHLFIVPSDTGAWFGFQDYDRIELMKISEDDIPKDTLAFSLPEISGLVTGHASFYHSESGFVSWFDRSFIYFCLKSEGNQDLEDRRTFCIEKINFR